MLHFAFTPWGIGLIVGAGSALLLGRRGKSVAGVAGTVVGGATEVLSRGANLLGLTVEKVEEKSAPKKVKKAPKS